MQKPGGKPVTRKTKTILSYTLGITCPLILDSEKVEKVPKVYC